MRGPDEQTQHMFSYLSPEQRVPADHPLRAIRALTDEALRSLSAQLARLVLDDGSAVDPAGAVAAGVAAASALHGPKRAAVDGGTRRQPAVPVVRRVAHGRPGLAPDDLYEEPGPAAGRRGCGGLLRRDRPSSPGGRSALRRALHRGRHAVGSLGEPEELPPAHGAGGAASRRPRQSDGQCPRRASAQRHARVDDGPAGAAVSEGLRDARRPWRTWATSCSTTAMGSWPTSV